MLALTRIAKVFGRGTPNEVRALQGVDRRIEEIKQFYNTPDPQTSRPGRNTAARVWWAESFRTRSAARRQG